MAIISEYCPKGSLNDVLQNEGTDGWMDGSIDREMDP